MPSSDHRLAQRHERIVSSSQYSEGKFKNTRPVGPGLRKGTTLSTMGKFFFGGGHRVPIAPLPAEDPREPWTRAVDSGLRATWLGHSTVLLEIDGLRVLTDPVWGERASPASFAGPKRFQPVPVGIEGLPPLEAIVVSHDHYDHLCRASIVKLAATTTTPIFTSLGVGARLENWGIAPERVVELDWWDSAQTQNGLTVTAAPSQHFSGRRLGDRNTTLWSSFAMRGEKHAVFFSGDTGLTDEYTQIRDMLGPFDLVMLEVGAFHPAWGDIHLGPQNALAAVGMLGATHLLPVHWGTFNLAIHDWDEPVETLLRLADQRGTRLVMPKLGAPVEPARAGLVDPWWRPVTALEHRRVTSTPSVVPHQLKR